MGRPLEEIGVLAHQVGLVEALFHVAKRQVNLFHDVAASGLVVNLDVLAGQRLLNRKQRGQRLVLHVDQFQRGLGGLLVHAQTAATGSPT